MLLLHLSEAVLCCAFLCWKLHLLLPVQHFWVVLVCAEKDAVAAASMKLLQAALVFAESCSCCCLFNNSALVLLLFLDSLPTFIIIIIVISIFELCLCVQKDPVVAGKLRAAGGLAALQAKKYKLAARKFAEVHCTLRHLSI